jgi:hypothetical protein
MNEHEVQLWKNKVEKGTREYKQAIKHFARFQERLSAHLTLLLPNTPIKKIETLLQDIYFESMKEIVEENK